MNRNRMFCCKSQGWAAWLPTVLLVAAIAFQLDARAEPPHWVVRDADSELVLFPTIHALPGDLEWTTERLLEQFAEAEEVWFEIDPAEARGAAVQRLVMEKGMDLSRPLSAVLDRDQFARLETVADSLGLPVAQLEPMRPWLASVTLTSMAMRQSGFDSGAGVEARLRTRIDGQALRQLETVEEQLGLLADLPEALQIELLESTFDEIDDFADELRALAEDWAQGDVADMERLLVEEMAAEYPELYEVVFTRRNANWVAIIERELAGSGSDFIAVGAGHLLGDDSVIAMLRKRGWTVERFDGEAVE
ncbi:TraB/GumN family protein [Wenzhouxiangella sp. XN79A]|uniref:TraB/GumN family protein n=1 Tax=Wenzhouxiangella sp. XN79A TaxID=2724193 RepID=UPI00144A79D5|nr:TraB/GumN family protein [Wenzhouxiangella sp. XN79A]NKI35629.1 TraB/GumN family protein [Wenzhouxiangella sp. XN79A]